MQENFSFYLAARERFPALAQRADRHYLNYWGEMPWRKLPTAGLNAQLMR
jgi:hypothetical protein